MMIWHFNLRKQEVYLPQFSVVVPGVKTLNDAHELIENENFNPADWTYVVKSKKSKIYNFSLLEEAVAVAQKKSSKGTPYTVFNNGKVVASYVGNKKLPIWTTLWESKNEYRTKKNEFYYQVPKGKFCQIENLFSYSIDVTEGKVRHCTTFIKFVKCKNGHLRTEFSKRSITFNKDGSVYYYNNGRVEHTSARILSIYIEKDGENILRKELTKLRPEIRPILETVPCFNLPAAFSRPTAYYMFDTYRKQCRERIHNVYFGCYPKEIIDESKMTDVLCKRMHIPCTKGLKKLYLENPYNMDVVHWLKSVGFKDINSYHKLTAVGVHFCMYNPKKFKDFFKKFIELRGENNVVKMTADTNFNIIKDVAYSYPSIDETSSEFVLKKARNFEEIHETFNRCCPVKTKTQEIAINYTDTEKKRFNLCCNDDVRFELAYSNKDLAIIGAEMGICVGGYANSAISKHTTIVKMAEGDKYVACIEVTNNKLIQLKAKFNNPVESKYKKYIDEWLSHAKLNKTCCSDYYSIGKPWHSEHNYAHIRPERYAPAERHPVFQIIKTNHTSCKHNNSWFAKSQTKDDRFYENDNGEGMTLNRHGEVRFTAVETDELPF